MKLLVAAVVVLAAPALLIVLNDLVRLAQWLWRARSPETLARMSGHIDNLIADETQIDD